MDLVNQASLAEEGGTLSHVNSFRALQESASRGHCGATASDKLRNEPGWLQGVELGAGLAGSWVALGE